MKRSNIHNDCFFELNSISQMPDKVKSLYVLYIYFALLATTKTFILQKNNEIIYELMALKNELRNQGDWLFKHRSYLPLLLLPLVILGVLTGSFLPENRLVEMIFTKFCLLVSFLGLAVRIITIGHVPRRTSGRNTQNQIADSLNTTGIYSVVRHPLYLGNFLMWLGIILFVQSWWLLFIFCLLYWIYYERIMYAEESFLQEKFGEDYFNWSEKTPPFFPNFRKWKKSELDFSLRKVLRMEYSGFFGMICCFVFLHIFRNFIETGRFEVSNCWLGIFIFSLLAYLVLRFLKKKTKVLNVAGR
ncbi:MAG TPA: DUF1295 domain-containing protein [Candidatus Cloacimonetes bacterium]|nr:DUF1295 domain-containing protein [Candidatus Cloacimonadota bacterium]